MSLHEILKNCSVTDSKHRSTFDIYASFVGDQKAGLSSKFIAILTRISEHWQKIFFFLVRCQTNAEEEAAGRELLIHGGYIAASGTIFLVLGCTNSLNVAATSSVHTELVLSAAAALFV